MKSSTTNKTKSNKEPEYDSDFSEDNEKNTTKSKNYSRTTSSDSNKQSKKKPPAASNAKQKNTNNNNNNRASYSTDSRSNSSRTVSRSRSVSKSRSLSPINKNGSNKNTSKTNGNGNTHNTKLSNFKARSTDIYDSNRVKKTNGQWSKNSDIYPRRNVFNNKPGMKPIQKVKMNQRNSVPNAPEQLSQAAIRVMSAQRHKNTDLQNRIAEMNLEMDKLREENKTLRRVHLREEVAIKRFESQDTDLNRLMRNHTDETNALKEQIKKLKLETRRLNSNLIDKEEEVRSVRKKNDEFKKILNDKKLLDSVELTKTLEQTEKDIQELKIKLENSERKIEMMEKNHKHEMGVEIAHHKEVQRNLLKLSEENRELKVKLEEKERALDITNIYSNRQQLKEPVVTNGATTWKTSSNSLNNTPNETPRESQQKKKEAEKLKKLTEKPKHLKPAKEEPSSKDDAKTTKAILNEIELKAQKEDAQLKMQEIEMKIKQQEMDLKRKDAAERMKREQQQKDDEERIKQMQKQKKLDEEKKKHQLEEDKKLEAKSKQNTAEEEEKKRIEKERLEEEDRKKRWISSKTVDNVKLSEEKEKNSLEKSKKDELLAKLALLDNGSGTGNSNNNSSNNDSNASTALKPPKSDQNLNQSKPLASFGSNNNHNNNTSALPPKPFQFSNNTENFHDGKPTSYNREPSNTSSNKNDLLTKLFASNQNNNINSSEIDSMFSSNTINNNSNRFNQSKLDKIDDIFTNGKNGDKSKANLMPWEVESAVVKKPEHTNSFNRPKLDNKPLFNVHNDNYTEDIEELAL